MKLLLVTKSQSSRGQTQIQMWTNKTWHRCNMKGVCVYILYICVSVSLHLCILYISSGFSRKWAWQLSSNANLNGAAGYFLILCNLHMNKGEQLLFFFVHIESLVSYLPWSVWCWPLLWHSPGFCFCSSVTFFQCLVLSSFILLLPGACTALLRLSCYIELIGICFF